MPRTDFRSDADSDTATQTTKPTLIDDVVAETTMTEIMQSEIRAKIGEAREHPRKVQEFLDEAVAMATLTPEIAASCRYVLERWSSKEKKKVYITGPSIRLAEICAIAWGNLDWGARPIAGARDGAKQILVEGWATDYQKNVTKRATVTRKTTYKDGRAYNADLRILAINAASSIASRNALFGVIPRAVVEEVMNKAVDVALGRAKGLKVRRDEVIDKLIVVAKEHGADLIVPRILQSLGHDSIQQVNWDDVEVLIGKGVAINEELSTVDEAFPADVPIETTQTDGVVTDLLEWQNKTLGKVLWPGGKLRTELTRGELASEMMHSMLTEHREAGGALTGDTEKSDMLTADPEPTTQEPATEPTTPPANGTARDVEKVMVFQRDGLDTTFWSRARVLKELQVEGATVDRVMDAMEREFDARIKQKADANAAKATETAKDELPMDDWKPTPMMAETAVHEHKAKIKNARITQREAENQFLRSKSKQQWHDWIRDEGKKNRAQAKKGGK